MTEKHDDDNALRLSDGLGLMKTYTAKLKQRRRINREIPRKFQGWWADICPGKTLQLRDATASDIDRCFLIDGSSRNPKDYLCELPENGSLVAKFAISRLTPNAELSRALPELNETADGNASR